MGEEQQYGRAISELMRQPSCERQLGLSAGWTYWDDPKRLVFTLARYKFAAKMLTGKKNCLEVGCGDGFGSRILLQEVDQLTGIDVDHRFIEDAQERYSAKWPIEFKKHDILEGSVSGQFDSAVSLDVIEHIADVDHVRFFTHLNRSLANNAMVIIGYPSLESQDFASPQSKAGHISCMTQADGSKMLQQHYQHVLSFSMNDEVVHTGFYKMAHYNLHICLNPV